MNKSHETIHELYRNCRLNKELPDLDVKTGQTIRLYDTKIFRKAAIVISSVTFDLVRSQQTSTERFQRNRHKVRNLLGNADENSSEDSEVAKGRKSSTLAVQITLSLNQTIDRETKHHNFTGGKPLITVDWF